MNKVIEKYLRYSRLTEDSKVKDALLPILAQALLHNSISSSAQTIFNEKVVSVESCSYEQIREITMSILYKDSANIETASSIVENIINSMKSKDTNLADGITWIKNNIISDNIINRIAA